MKWARLDSRLILSFQLQYLDCIADVNYHGQILAMDIKDVTGVGERIVQSPRMVGTGWIRCFKLWVWITTFVHPPPLDITHTHQLWERSKLGKHWGPGHEVCIIKLLRFKDLTQTSASKKMCSIMTVMDLYLVNLQNSTPMDQCNQNMMQHHATSINAGVLSSSSGEAAGA